MSSREGRKVETGMSLDGWRKQAAWEGTVAHGDKPRWPDKQCTGRCRTQEPANGVGDATYVVR